MYDLIIIGGGPAAVSAGIYAARKKLKTLLICKDWSGQASLAPLVENYPGFEAISGNDLVSKFISQLKKNELEIKEGLEVKEVGLTDKKDVEVKTNNGDFQSKTLIIATGRHSKKTGLLNEEKFIGKGISYCATCDAPLFKDKQVAVIGAGNSGANIALDLTSYAAKVYLLGRRMKADEFLQEKIKKSSKIEVITNVSVKEFKGDEFIKELVYQEQDSGKDKELAVDGIFMAVGSVANSSFVKNVVELNKQGEIKIDKENRTSQPNIFAAGDVTDINHKQIVIAAGEGAKAALNVYEYIKSTT